VSWAWWDWPLTWLTNHRPSVLFQCWLGHLSRKSSLKWPIMSRVFVRPFILFQLANTIFWKTNQPIVIQNDTSCPRSDIQKVTVRGHTRRKVDLEAPLSTTLGWVDFLVLKSGDGEITRTAWALEIRRQDLCLEQSAAQSQTMWAVIRQVQTVTEDISIRTVRPRRSVICLCHRIFLFGAVSFFPAPAFSTVTRSDSLKCSCSVLHWASL